MPYSEPRLDREVPALLVKVGHYPQHHGALGAVRSLGRAGVPVYAMVESRNTPTAVSRYLAEAFVRPSSGREDVGELVARLVENGRAIGRRSVAIATDDEAAVLLAEHADELSEHFLLPPVPAGLPRRLASKEGLRLICGEHGVATPRARVPGCRTELLAAAAEWGLPLVLKNLEAWTRLERPAVTHNTAVVSSERELLAMWEAGRSAQHAPSLLAQEYLPPEHSEDWFTHLCCGPGGEPLVVFTGLKLRSWPPTAGITTRARALPNPELAELAVRLCRRIGYSGAADLDWRLDLRDGRYKLVDFNPRTGAQFRLFETVHGVDVVRALHLSLTGRPVPPGPQVVRSFGLGQLDLPSAAVWTWQQRALPRDVAPRRGTERAWLCRDDPVPPLVELGWFTAMVAHRLSQPLRRA
ncbi:ATP-grasp domain-containing protein [Kitasatospora sp. NPDC127111]|uniref:carboxylate--amine ligase n=1 Tax=Kitasatospora sp. NPDC127111 TaxID=3345363 RepID=UPI0036311021